MGRNPQATGWVRVMENHMVFIEINGKPPANQQNMTICCGLLKTNVKLGLMNPAVLINPLCPPKKM